MNFIMKESIAFSEATYIMILVLLVNIMRIWSLYLPLLLTKECNVMLNLLMLAITTLFKLQANCELHHDLIELLQNMTQLCFYLKLQSAMFGKSSLDSVYQNIQIFVDDPNV